MNKRGDIPFWLVTLILVLLGMIIIILLITAAGGKMQDFVRWIAGIF